MINVGDGDFNDTNNYFITPHDDDTKQELLREELDSKESEAPYKAVRSAFEQVLSASERLWNICNGNKPTVDELLNRLFSDDEKQKDITVNFDESNKGVITNNGLTIHLIGGINFSLSKEHLEHIYSAYKSLQ